MQLDSGGAAHHGLQAQILSTVVKLLVAVVIKQLKLSLSQYLK